MRNLSSVDCIAATLLAALGILTVQACGSDEPSHPCLSPQPVVVQGVDTGYDMCAGGSQRRRQIVACPSALPRSEMCMGDPAIGECTTDADCTAKPNGFCTGPSFEAGPGCFCQFGCVSDADCAAGSICVCGSVIGVCVPSTCTSDAACGGAGCVSYAVDPACGGRAFACQTHNEECVSDADCGQNQQCSYDGGHFVCADINCVIGRPFLVAGSARTAPAAPRRDWMAGITLPDVSDLSAEERAELGERWTAIARMEHASIAAFARFVLQLMSMGAPPELIERAQAAMADETEHAKMCFALASAYRGRDVGPGRLAIEGSLDESDPRRIVAMVIREGCIGETVAAAEAAEGLRHAKDPAVREVLAKVARDETSHAELAWRALGWALAAGDKDLREAVAAELEAAIKEPLVSASNGAGVMREEELLAHGLVGESLRSELRRLCLARIIRPAARALLEHRGNAHPTPARPERYPRP
jgi:hypothetical protein